MKFIKVLEFASHGSLADYVKRFKFVNADRQLYGFCLDAVRGEKFHSLCTIMICAIRLSHGNYRVRLEVTVFEYEALRLRRNKLLFEE